MLQKKIKTIKAIVTTFIKQSNNNQIYINFITEYIYVQNTTGRYTGK